MNAAFRPNWHWSPAGRLRRSLTLAAVLAFGVNTVFAATAATGNFRNYSVDDGLSQNSVSSIIQDRRGFIWIGTQDGLNRFDGFEFRVYRSSPSDERSIADNDVLSLYEDDTGRLWVGTNHAGLSVFDPESESVRRVPLDPFLANGDRVTVITGDRDGAIYVGSSTGLLQIARERGNLQAKAIPELARLAGYHVTDLMIDGQGVLWIATNGGGLHTYFPLTGETRQVSLPPRPGLDTDSVWALAESASGAIWAGLNGPFVFLHRPKEDSGVLVDLRSSGANGASVRDMLVDDFDSLWVAGLGVGLQRVASDGSAVVSYAVDPGSRAGIDDVDTFSLFKDRTGVLWVGTLSAGIDTLDLYSGGFELFQRSGSATGGLSHDMVVAFAEDAAGAVWIGTDGGGVNRVDPVTGSYEVFDSDSGRIGDDRIWALAAGGAGRLWAGSWGGGLYVRPEGAGVFEQVLPNGPGDAQGIEAITALAEDASERLWIGTVGEGLKRLDVASNSLQDIVPVLDDGTRLSLGRVGSLFFDRSRNSLWIGTADSGLLEARANGSYRQWLRGPGDALSLPSNIVRSVSPAGKDRLLVSTAVGIAVLDRDTGAVVSTYTEKDGLPEGTVYGAAEDGDGRIWVSSNRGLARIDPIKSQVRRFDPRDGLQGYEYNGDAVLEDRFGRIYFGGTKGFNRFTPDDVRDNPFPPPLALTRFRLFGQEQPPGGAESVLEKSVSHVDSLELEHRQNVLTLEFAGLHFVSPERNRYVYRLDGFDRDWIAAEGPSRSATYTNLDPGRYRFRVRGANSDGVWGDEEAGLDIRVLAPWWATPAAFLAYTLAALLAVTVFVRWRTLSLRAQAEQLRRTVNERTELVTQQKETIEQQALQTRELLHAKEQLFARVSHEFRTPLTLILGSAGRIERDPSKDRRQTRLASIRSSGERLLRLVDQLLFLASNDGPRAERAVTQCASEIVASAVRSFEGLAASRDIRFRVDVTPGLFVRAEPEALETIVQNLLSNAVKFAPRGSIVDVLLEPAGESATLTVRDYGSGIDSDLLDSVFQPFRKGVEKASGSGIGLALVNETAARLGGYASADNPADGGARFVVGLPLAADPGADAGSVAHDYLAREVEATRHALLASAAARERPAETDLRNGETSVLIVEDDPELRTFLTEILERDYEVTAAEDGEAALETIRDVVPDVVVSDVMMPNMDGYAFCRALKTDDRTSHIPVVLLTARSDSASLMQGLEEGADEYLTKPFDERELLLRIRNLLETRQMLKARVAALYRGVDDAVTRKARQTDSGLNKRDRAFLDRIEATMQRHHADQRYSIAELAADVAMSERQLQRKLKALTNRSPSEHLRVFRLERAAAMINDGESLGDVAFATGFASQSHFGACFKAYFGCTPGEYRKPPAS